RIVDAPHVQLDLSRDEAVRPDALPALLAELSADIGDENVGVLAIVDTHRPEARSKLSAPAGVSTGKPRRAALEEDSREPTRLLPAPIPLCSGKEGSIAIGSTVFVGHATFEIVRVAFDRRLDGIEWWSRSGVSRDYVNVWLAPLSGRPADGRSIAEGWAYVDRATGEVFLHGLWE
ncbi:MAG: DNA polymerase Y family protein, partial [Polyangiaceae bacterium]